MSRPKNSPNDPDRRQRILAATMSLLRRGGVGAVTARGVAEEAGVPVGSVSYYFESVQSLLREAARGIVEIRIAALDQWAQGVTSATAPRRLAELICSHITHGRDVTVLAYELYVLGLRDPEVRLISEQVTESLRSHLALFVPPERAAGLAALADGLQLHALVVEPALTVEEAEATLSASWPDTGGDAID